MNTVENIKHNGVDDAEAIGSFTTNKRLARYLNVAGGLPSLQVSA